MWGTGFVVDGQRHVVTADHVTRDCAEVTLFRLGTRMAAVVEARDRENDLSLLRTVPEVGAPVEFATGDALMRGSFVLVAAYAEGSGAATPSRRLLFNGMLIADPGDARARRFYIVSDARPGSSGSPVIESRGFVAGVVSAKVTWHGPMASGRPTELRVAVSGSVVKDFLRREGIAFLEAKNASARGLSRASDLLENSELRVECRR
jgi:S1-C subfamily serine protease